MSGSEVDAKAIRACLKAEKNEDGLPLCLRCASVSTGDLVTAKGILECVSYLNSLWRLVPSGFFPLTQWMGPREQFLRDGEVEACFAIGLLPGTGDKWVLKRHDLGMERSGQCPGRGHPVQ